MEGPLGRIKARIMDNSSIERSMVRIAHEILERHKGTESIAVVGIRTGGVYLARKLASNIGDIEGVEIPCGALDVTMYRDDIRSRVRKQPPGRTEIDFPIDGMKVVLVDDVLYTGRTIRAAMDSLMDLGRPKMIQLAVLVDRGHKELPITADYVGKNVPTSNKESVKVLFSDDGRPDEVVIVDAEDGDAS